MNDRSAVTSSHGVNAGSVARSVSTVRSRSVHPLEHAHARVGAQPRVQLTVAHVDRVDAARAVLEQAVREAARRGAGVDGRPSLDADRETFQRGLELLPAAADEWCGSADERDGLVGCDQAGRLVGRGARDEDGSRLDGRARVLA